MSQKNFNHNKNCMSKDSNDNTMIHKHKFKEFLANLNGLTSKELTINSLDFIINTIEETTTQIDTMPKYSCNVLDPNSKLQYNGLISPRLSYADRSSMEKSFSEQSKNRIRDYQTIIDSLKFGLANESEKYPDPIPLYKTITYNKFQNHIQENHETISSNINESGTARKRTPKKKSNFQLFTPKENNFAVKTINKSNNITNEVFKECNRTFEPDNRSSQITSKKEKKVATFQSSPQKNHIANQTKRNMKGIDFIEKVSISKLKPKGFSKAEMMSEQMLYNSNPIKNNSQNDKKKEVEKYSTPSNIKDFTCLSSEKKASLKTKDTIKKEIPVIISESYYGQHEKIDKCKAKPKINVEEEKNTSRLVTDIRIEIDSDSEKNDLKADDERNETKPYLTKHKISNQRLFTASPLKRHLTLTHYKRESIDKYIHHSFDVENNKQIKFETCCAMGDNCLFNF